MGLSRRADPLRAIAERLGLVDFRKITQVPTIGEALRVTVHHADGTHPDSVATLVRGHHQKNCDLTVVYDRSPKRATLQFSISLERYQRLLMALRRARFDNLDDQPDLPFIGVRLWLVERSAASFYHDVVLGPNDATGNYREIMRAFQDHLAESVRTGA